MKELDPPAIVREDSSEMDQLFYEATSALEAGEKAARTTLERYRDAGEALTKARAKCPPKGWIALLEARGVNRMVAWKAIRIFLKWDECNFKLHSSVDATIKALAEGGEEEEKPDGRELGDEEDDEDKTTDQLILCERCQRIGKPVVDCEGCKEARDAQGVTSTGRKKRKRKKKTIPQLDLKDHVGNVVPDHCRDAFADDTLEILIGELEAIETSFSPESWTKLAGGLVDHYGFILIDKFDEHSHESLARIQYAIEALKAGIPYAICPKCHAVDSRQNGKTCTGCRGYGHVPEHRYGELTQ